MASNLETLRKIVMTGIGAALMTEESLARLLGEVKLPRDAKKYLVNQAAKKKSELAGIIAEEVKGFLGRINIHEEIRKAVSGMKIDIEATIHVDRHGSKIQLSKSKVIKPTAKRRARRVTKRSK